MTATTSVRGLRLCAGVVLCVALVACSRREAASSDVERVVIELDTARATRELADPRAPSWALEGTWITTDARDARTAAFGEEVSFPLALGDRVEVAGAFALRLPPAADRDDRTVECEMRFVGKGRSEVLASAKRTFHEAAHAWSELQATVAHTAEDPGRLVFVARVLTGSAPDGARACFAVPVSPRASNSATQKPNLLVISVDALRADHLGAYGYPRKTSPNIDALLARGARFEHAISVSPWTLPSYGSLFTGVMPTRHRAGVSPSREASFLDGRRLEKGDFQTLSSEYATLASFVAAAGYRTAGFVSNPFLDPATEIDEGFSRWVVYVNRAQAGVELAQSWIEEQGSAPWFAFVHLMDPHAPYTPPPPFDERFSGRAMASIGSYPPEFEGLRRMKDVDPDLKQLLIDMYDGEIAYTDDRIGALLEFLRARGDLDHTLVVFHSDHGEEFWEHGSCEHGQSMHVELLHVPLGFVLPGRIPAGKVIAEPRSTVDVFPTILDLLGLLPREGRDRLDGRSLLPDIEGAAGSPRDCVSETLLYGAREQKALASGGFKLITDGGAKNGLFDLAADPSESRNLAAENPARVQPLRDALIERARRAQASSAGTRAVEFSGARRNDLEKLGYTAAGTESPERRR